MSPTTTTSTQLKDTAPRFVHLHLHTEYSLLDGGNSIKRLIDRVKTLGMDAVAVTDHGNIHGAVEFHDAARAQGIKPILGIEAYVAVGDRVERARRTDGPDGGFHLVLLSETHAGWRNIVKLSSDAYINGFYYKPRMDKSTLAEFTGGIIAINGHLGSSLAYHLVNFEKTGDEKHFNRAVDEARWHQKVFAPNENGDPCFYVELQRHLPEQEAINPHLKRLAELIGAPLVVDNDAHFLTRDDHDMHDTLCCISMAKNKHDDARFRYPESLYVKSPQEMQELFPDEPEALLNSALIADRCDVDLSTTDNHAPIVEVVHPGDPPKWKSGDRTAWFEAYCSKFELIPFDAKKHPEKSMDDLTAECDRALRDLCEAGLVWRYGPEGVTDVIRARLERELGILSSKLISAYFLIVWDVVNWARQHSIPTNARGSGVGTMVGFLLGLSNACPEQYGLLFERFTDPDRAEYPDIDIDMCQDGRADVINYVKERYGHVAQIITFGRLKARAAIKDVSRVMGLEPHEGQRLANLVPDELGITIDAALAKEPALSAECEKNPTVARILEHARALEGHARHSSVHAAGVVIATRPLDEIVPLCTPQGSHDIVTQWDGPTCEKQGLLKMDFLGLRTLSTIERAKAIVCESMDEQEIWRARGLEPPAKGKVDDRSHPLDLERLDYTDQKVLDLFRRADTDGVFQFESEGMRRLLVDLQPDRLEDLIAANALFRPGPMDLIDDFVARKRGQQAVPAVHEIVDRFTEETYGIMVYQEQVMQVLHHLGGVALRQAYTIIKAISKKKYSVINAAREEFVAGCSSQGIGEDDATALFELITKFAKYGFNKSHSTSYSIVAFQTAYLKTYYPAQYMAAVLSFESNAKKVEDWLGYMDGCRRVPWPDSSPETPHVGIEVRPPDLNTSLADFSVAFGDNEPHTACNGYIRFGLSAIKGAGRDAIDAIIAQRESDGRYLSLHDFCERVDHGRVNTKTLELLVKAGAFDSVHGIDARAAMLETLPAAVAAGRQLAKDRAAGQAVLFGGASTEDDASASANVSAALVETVPWDRMTALTEEKEALGFHVSGHPMDEYHEILHDYCNATSQTLDRRPNGSVAIVGGIVARVRPIVTKRGDKMAMLSIEDKAGLLDAVVFPEAFGTFGSQLEKDRMLIFVGRVELERAAPTLQVEAIYDLADAPAFFARGIDVLIDAREDDEPGAQLDRLRMVAGVLKSASASASRTPGRVVPPTLQVDASDVEARVSIVTDSMPVVPTAELLAHIAAIVGPSCVRARGGYLPQLKERRPRGPRPVRATAAT